MASNNFSYKIDNIELTEFIFRTHGVIEKNSKFDVHFDIKVNNRISSVNSLIIQNIIIDIFMTNSNEHLAGISLFIGFKIDDFEKNIKFDKKTSLYDIISELESLITNISLGTCRGILYSRLQGTYLSNAILPVLSNTLIKKNVTTGD